MRRLYRPETLDEALKLLSQGRGHPLAGGTDVYPAVAQGQAWAVDAPANLGGEDLIDIAKLSELRGTRETATSYEFGAGTTWTEVIDAGLPACFDGLKLAAREVGGRQIQNQGTLAGNLCNASPAADGVPVLLTLNAAVHLQSLAGGTRELPLEAFITGVRETARRPEELVTAIVVPKLPEAARSSFLKLGARRYLVISIAMVSAVVVPSKEGLVEELRVAVGACSAVAARLSALERRALGKPLETLASLPLPEDVAGLEPISDPRASADYRQEAALVLTRRVLASLSRDAMPKEAAA